MNTVPIETPHRFGIYRSFLLKGDNPESGEFKFSRLNDNKQYQIDDSTNHHYVLEITDGGKCEHSN